MNRDRDEDRIVVEIEDEKNAVESEVGEDERQRGRWFVISSLRVGLFYDSVERRPG